MENDSRYQPIAYTNASQNCMKEKNVIIEFYVWSGNVSI
jgi:hypothetical protein